MIIVTVAMILGMGVGLKRDRPVLGLLLGLVVGLLIIEVS